MPFNYLRYYQYAITSQGIDFITDHVTRPTISESLDDEAQTTADSTLTERGELDNRSDVMDIGLDAV